MSETEETTEIIVTIQLPKKIASFMKDFCQFADTTIEELCKKETEQMIKDFYHGGFYENWSQKAFTKRGVAEYFRVQS